jgi:hypothetical protein
MKFSNYFIVNVSIFVAGFLCLLFSIFSPFINFLALLFIGVGTLMISYKLLSGYNIFKSNVTKTEKEILLEIATEEGGEQFVYKNTPFTSKQKRKIKEMARERKTSIVVSAFIGIALIYLAFRVFFI